MIFVHYLWRKYIPLYVNYRGSMKKLTEDEFLH